MWMRVLSTRSVSTSVAAASTPKPTARSSTRLLFTTARSHKRGQEPIQSADSTLWILAATVTATAAVTLFGGTPPVTFAEAAHNKKLQQRQRAAAPVFPNHDITCLPHGDAIVLTNNNNNNTTNNNGRAAHGARTIILVGGVNNSGESCDFVATLVQQVRPQAVYIDMNQRVFDEFGIRARVEATRKNMTTETESSRNYNETTKKETNSDDDDDDDCDTVWKNLKLLPQIQGELSEIPDTSQSSFLTSLDPPVSKSIQAVFGQLRLAGVESGDRVDNWTHIVRALQEGIAMDADIILGGRGDHHPDLDVDIIQRGEEAMLKSNRKAASELVYRIRPTWDERLPARLNFKAIRQAIREMLPVFEKVVFQEVDCDTARKLDQLDMYPCIVVVVMMIHLDGVEQELTKLGWVPLLPVD